MFGIWTCDNMEKWKRRTARKNIRHGNNQLGKNKVWSQRWRNSKKRKRRYGKRYGHREKICFPEFCGSSGWKKRLPAKLACQIRNETLQPSVAQSTLGSQKWPKKSDSEHVLKLRCRKSALVAQSTFWSKKLQHTCGLHQSGNWDEEHAHAIRAWGTMRKKIMAKAGTTFESCDMEKLHPVLERSTCSNPTWTTMAWWLQNKLDILQHIFHNNYLPLPQQKPFSQPPASTTTTSSSTRYYNFYIFVIFNSYNDYNHKNYKKHNNYNNCNNHNN